MKTPHETIRHTRIAVLLIYALHLGCTSQPADVGSAVSALALDGCTNVTSDPANCGNCGFLCDVEQDCLLGICVPRAEDKSVAGTSTDSLTSQGTWFDRGPALGGRLDGFVVKPPLIQPDPTLVVASPGGGLWRKLESATTWGEPANYGGGDYSLVHLEWDILDGNRLYAQTWNGLRVTTDLGDHWTDLVGLGATPSVLLPESSGITDPKPFAQLQFSATQRVVLTSRPCRGLYYSFDGTTFAQHYPFPGETSNPDNCIGNIVADPGSRQVYFSTLYTPVGERPHIYRSACPWFAGSPCLVWQLANFGLPVPPAGTVIASLASASYGGIGNKMVALLMNVNGTDTFRTTDGLNWTQQGSTLTGQYTPRPLVYARH